MKFILPITIACLAVSGCKNKELPSEYLSRIHVVRESSGMTAPHSPALPPEGQTLSVSTPPSQERHPVYHVIVGSFSQAEKVQAERLTEKLKAQGYPASIIHSAQRYRVSIKSFPTASAANAAREEYRALTDREDIWVLK